jgi:hypothetical protein
LREEGSLRVRKIFGSMRVKVTGEWRKLLNEELNLSVLRTQYCWGDKIEKDEIGWSCNSYGGEEEYIQGFGGET